MTCEKLVYDYIQSLEIKYNNYEYLKITLVNSILRYVSYNNIGFTYDKDIESWNNRKLSKSYARIFIKY